MKAYITREAFDEARTPGCLKELMKKRNAEGAAFKKASELLSLFDDVDFVDAIFKQATCNADAFHLIKQMAQEAIDVGMELLRTIELWRAQSTMGKSAVLIEADRKLGVSVVVSGEVVVRCAECIVSEPLNGRDPEQVAIRLLQMIEPRAA